MILIPSIQRKETHAPLFVPVLSHLAIRGKPCRGALGPSEEYTLWLPGLPFART